MTSECEQGLIDSLHWLFWGVTSSGQYVFRDEDRNYLYIPGAKKNKLVCIK